MTDQRGPEILAPAGAPECLPAAVAGGAHAVFLGLRHFNARGRAENFRKADLPGHVAYLHDHQLKCYVVLNTLVHDDELPKALDLAYAAWRSGVDAAIIQDLGLWRMLARELPGLKRHASTQMTVHHPSQIDVLAQLGAERVILARELRREEVAACTRRADALGIETEHFVHGALCYAFSGQCLMSNFAGCRSANRGTCAQNCRFGYSSETSAQSEDTLLSMKDFNLLAHVAELADLGVASLKIEGRLKGPDYVFAVCKAYRAAVDAWQAGRGFDLNAQRDRLRTVFARPFTDSPWIGEYGDAARVHRRTPSSDSRPDATLLQLDRARGHAVVEAERISAGQGFRCALGMYQDGFLVIAADRVASRRWNLRIRISERGPRIPEGTPLFLNADQARQREASTAMAAVPLSAAEPTLGLVVNVRGEPEKHLEVSAISSDGRRAEVRSDAPIQTATGAALDAPSLRATLGALGGSGFAIDALHNELTGACFVPASHLKQLRRELVAQLIAQPIPTPAITAPQWQPPEIEHARRRSTALWVACGSIDCALAALDAGADAAWLDDAQLDLWAAQPPRIVHRDGLWLRHPATAPLSPHLAAIGLPVVAGHLGVIRAAHAAGVAVIADHPLNIYSSETCAALADLGAHAAVLSLECSMREIARLAGRMAARERPLLAMVVHGRLPAMLTRQDHGLRIGATRPIQASERESGLPYVWQRRHHDTVVWEARELCAPATAQLTAGVVDAWVLELGHCTAEQLAPIIESYRRLRDHADNSQDIIAATTASSRAGIFAGHLDIGARELDGILDESN